MYLIVGLGNPDKQYEKTFHNMGYIAVGDAAELLGTKFKKKECEASVAEAYIGGEKVILARPLTYMNNSGSAGTHNGMRSIIGETGLKDFPRIRIGIRDEEVDIPIINYVLSEVRKEDYELFSQSCRKAGEAAAEFARGLDIEKVMCKYN